MKVVRFYALVDDTGEMYYIGKTERALQERLKEHISACQQNKPGRGIRKCKRLLSIDAPKIVQLDVKEYEDDTKMLPYFYEMELIFHYLALGVKLTNTYQGCFQGTLWRKD